MSTDLFAHPGVFTLYSTIATTTEDLLSFDPDSNWPREELWEYQRLQDFHRKREWVAGRRLARQLLVDSELIPPGTESRVVILTQNDKQQGIAPQLWIDGTKSRISLSLSHSTRSLIVAASCEWKVGVDLVDKISFEYQPLRHWFQDAELEWIDHWGVAELALAWGIKEAFYKAANQGESFAPKSILVQRTEADFPSYQIFDSQFPPHVHRNCEIMVSEIENHKAVLVCCRIDSDQL